MIGPKRSFVMTIEIEGWRLKIGIIAPTNCWVFGLKIAATIGPTMDCGFGPIGTVS